ncbi:MAG TPA: DUF6531 domain-containing protein [Methylobacter sp.]|jgi:hypothetical protein
MRKQLILLFFLILFSSIVLSDNYYPTRTYRDGGIYWPTAAQSCQNEATRMHWIYTSFEESAGTYRCQSGTSGSTWGFWWPITFSCPYGGSLAFSGGVYFCQNASACPTGHARDAITGACGLPPKSNGDGGNDCPKGNTINFGNPINAGTGNKWQHEIDLSASAFGLGFDRYYNASTSTTANASNLGAGWSHAYTRSSTIQASGT